MLDFTHLEYENTHLLDKLEYCTASGALWQANPEQFLLEVPAVARYLVAVGKSIAMCPEPGAPSNQIEYFMKMTPLAAFAYQRGCIAIHAAAIANEHGALLLAGDSGSGKSTLLAALLRQGWRILSDDIAVISLNDNSLPVVHPVSPEIALYHDSLEHLGLQADSSGFIDARRRLYSPKSMFTTTPCNLRGIVRLTPHGKQQIECFEIEKSVGFKMLGGMLYNSQIAEVLCNRIDYFRCTSAIAQSVKLHVLCRPYKTNVDSLIDYLMTEQEGKNVLSL